ncbi:MAG: ATP-binding protein [bacterium]
MMIKKWWAKFSSRGKSNPEIRLNRQSKNGWDKSLLWTGVSICLAALFIVWSVSLMHKADQHRKSADRIAASLADLNRPEECVEDFKDLAIFDQSEVDPDSILRYWEVLYTRYRTVYARLTATSPDIQEVKPILSDVDFIISRLDHEYFSWNNPPNQENLFCDYQRAFLFVQQLDQASKKMKTAISTMRTRLMITFNSLLAIVKRLHIVVLIACILAVVNVLLLMFTRRSIRKRRQMEIELLRNAHLASIGMLTAGIAHNLNVPLQCLSSSVELIKMTHQDVPNLEVMLNQIQKIKGIVDNMLDKSRKEMSQEAQQININRLLQEELSFLEADLTFKHQIQKEFHFDPEIPDIRGYYGDFSQALLNIIKNAVDAMYQTDRKKLTIRTKQTADGGISVEIADSGVGIPQKDLQNIFNPFFTTKPSAYLRKESEPCGTGLGLASTYQLLKHYRARIEVQSEVSVGTTFTVTFPADLTVESESPLEEEQCEVEVTP